MGVMQAQPSTLTHCCWVNNLPIFRRCQERHVSPTMRASHCSVDNSWYCSTYSSGAYKPIENNTSLPIADYSLLDQLVQTGLWHLSTETVDVLRSSDARQLSLVGEHGHHPVTPVHRHRNVRVQAARSDRVWHTQYLRHLDQNESHVVSLGPVGRVAVGSSMRMPPAGDGLSFLQHGTDVNSLTMIRILSSLDIRCLLV